MYNPYNYVFNFVATSKEGKFERLSTMVTANSISEAITGLKKRYKDADLINLILNDDLIPVK